MYILGKDLKEFRKKHKISITDIGIPSHAVYGIESKTFKAPYYGRLNSLLDYYTYILREKESTKLESYPVPISQFYELGQLDTRVDSIEQEINEINTEIQKLLHKVNELTNQVNKLEMTKHQLGEEITKVEECLIEKELAVVKSAQKEGIMLSGCGTTVLSPYQLEPGIYTVYTELPNEPVSFVIMYEHLNSKRSYFSAEPIEGESFEIKQKGYYLFYVFATEGLGWNAKIKKATGIELILGSPIEALGLDDYTEWHLHRMDIRKVKDLTNISMNSLRPEINKFKVQKALESVGLSMKQVLNPKLIHEPENLNVNELFTSRTSNCLEGIGINTVEQLLKFSEEELLKIRGLGRRSLWDITSQLEELGLNLSKENDSWKIEQKIRM